MGLPGMVKPTHVKHIFPDSFYPGINSPGALVGRSLAGIKDIQQGFGC